MKAVKAKRPTKGHRHSASAKEDFDESAARRKNIESAKDLDADKLMQLMERTKRLRIATEHDDD